MYMFEILRFKDLYEWYAFFLYMLYAPLKIHGSRSSCLQHLRTLTIQFLNTCVVYVLKILHGCDWLHVVFFITD